VKVHTLKTMKIKMETRIFLTIAILAFNLNYSFAGNAAELSVNLPVSHDMISLAPATPGVADFSDLIPEPAPAVLSLIPATPEEAGFDDDYGSETDINLLNDLSPTTPKEADFEDSITPDNNTLSMTPAMPHEAGFEESI
jgi:hypothetical protein